MTRPIRWAHFAALLALVGAVLATAFVFQSRLGGQSILSFVNRDEPLEIGKCFALRKQHSAGDRFRVYEVVSVPPHSGPTESSKPEHLSYDTSLCNKVDHLFGEKALVVFAEVNEERLQRYDRECGGAKLEIYSDPRLIVWQIANFETCRAKDGGYLFPYAGVLSDRSSYLASLRTLGLLGSVFNDDDICNKDSYVDFAGSDPAGVTGQLKKRVSRFVEPAGVGPLQRTAYIGKRSHHDVIILCASYDFERNLATEAGADSAAAACFSDFG